VRLTRIFTPLAQNFSVPENGVCVDIGSGPLTVVSALYLSCPHLRAKNITWYCVDQSRAIMEKGEDLFFALCARMIAAHNTKTQTHTQATAQTEPFGEWRIVRVQGRAGVALRKKAHLVVAANVFNEIIEQTRLPLEKTAAREAANLLSYANDDATLVALEPGTPKPARFLSVLREYLISKNAVPFSPCLHSARCPMDGKKGGKWCHFSFDVNAAPERLLKLSRDAKLPKEKAALSFIAVRQNSLAVPQKESGIMPVRIASEAIKLPQDGRTGFYGCAHTGLVLAIARTRHPASGDVVNVQIPQNPVFDKKSGALITAIL
jgi:ribosomal protein RSM22 (predicted rRNA methylase)